MRAGLPRAARKCGEQAVRGANKSRTTRTCRFRAGRLYGCGRPIRRHLLGGRLKASQQQESADLHRQQVRACPESSKRWRVGRFLPRYRRDHLLLSAGTRPSSPARGAMLPSTSAWLRPFRPFHRRDSRDVSATAHRPAQHKRDDHRGSRASIVAISHLRFCRSGGWGVKHGHRALTGLLSRSTVVKATTLMGFIATIWVSLY